MKKIEGFRRIRLLLFSLVVVFGQFSFSNGPGLPIAKNSIISAEQTSKIDFFMRGLFHPFIKNRLDFNLTNEEVVGLINAQLEGLQIRRIELTETTIIKPSKIVMAIGNIPLGFEIEDQTHRFCFPCTVTHNSFEWGVIQK